MVVKLRDERDWKQFHNPKDLALTLTLEATEVLEHFQWKTNEESFDHIKKNKQKVAHELADVLYSVLLMANDFDIDLAESFLEKIEEISKKYPVEKSRGNHKKYTEL